VFTAYVENLENSVKILTASKNVKLVEETNEKKKRVFVSS